MSEWPNILNVEFFEWPNLAEKYIKYRKSGSKKVSNGRKAQWTWASEGPLGQLRFGQLRFGQLRFSQLRFGQLRYLAIYGKPCFSAKYFTAKNASAIRDSAIWGTTGLNRFLWPWKLTKHDHLFTMVGRNYKAKKLKSQKLSFVLRSTITQVSYEKWQKSW